MLKSKDAAVRAKGEALLAWGQTFLALYKAMFKSWERFKDDEMCRKGLTGAMVSHKVAFAQLFRHGAQLEDAKVAGTCRDLIRQWRVLWTFVTVPDVEPTNNEAERAVRQPVLLRRKSGGTRSEKGKKALGILLSVVETCRRQNRQVIDYFEEVIAAVNPHLPSFRPESPLYATSLTSAQRVIRRGPERALLEKETATAALEAEAREVRKASATFKLLASRELGIRLLVEVAWRELGISKALARFEAQHRCEFPVERIVFAMVVNRIADPKSKRACNDWVKEQAFFPEAKGWDVQHFYRALDVLHEHSAELEKLVGECLWEQLSDDERALQLIDITTTYFESRQTDREVRRLHEAWEEFDEDDDVPAPRRPRPTVVNERELRMRGHSKDGHPGDPQIVIANVCTPGGAVLHHLVFPGNTADVTVARALIADLPELPEGVERVWVSDAGMVSAELLGLIDEVQGWKRLTAEGPRKSELGRKLLGESRGRYRGHPTKPDFGYKVFEVSAEDSPSGKPETWLITRNERDRERQLDKIAEHIERVKDALAKQPPARAAHTKEVCKTVSNLSLKRYVKASENVVGAFVLDQEAIAQERKLAGVRFYRTTKTDWSGLDILNAYKALQDVEAKHRQYKQVLDLRPCYHRAEDRILAHVMLTVLAANVCYFLTRKTGKTIEQLLKLFANVKANEVQQGNQTYYQRTELNKEQEEVLERLGGRVPPRIWDEWIDAGRPPPGKRQTRARKEARA